MAIPETFPEPNAVAEDPKGRPEGMDLKEEREWLFPNKSSFVS